MEASQLPLFALCGLSDQLCRFSFSGVISLALSAFLLQTAFLGANLGSRTLRPELLTADLTDTLRVQMTAVYFLGLFPVVRLQSDLGVVLLAALIGTHCLLTVSRPEQFAADHTVPLTVEMIATL